MSKLRKNRAVNWTTNNTTQTGILLMTTPDHYVIDIPGQGAVNAPRDHSNQFEATSMANYHNYKAMTPIMEAVRTLASEQDEQTTEVETAEVHTDRPVRGRTISDKVYAGAGITWYRGKYKIRFTTDVNRYLVALGKGGHRDIVMAELPSGTKLDLVSEMMLHPAFQYELAQDLIAQYLIANQ